MSKRQGKAGLTTPEQQFPQQTHSLNIDQKYALGRSKQRERIQSFVRFQPDIAQVAI
jgi:hypothetical protein